MPQSEDLPNVIKPLAFYNPIEVAPGHDFHVHMDRLVDSIEKILLPDNISNLDQDKLDDTKSAFDKVTQSVGENGAPLDGSGTHAATTVHATTVQRRSIIHLLRQPRTWRLGCIVLAVLVGTGTAAFGLLPFMARLVPRPIPISETEDQSVTEVKNQAAVVSGHPSSVETDTSSPPVEESQVQTKSQPKDPDPAPQLPPQANQREAHQQAPEPRKEPEGTASPQVEFPKIQQTVPPATIIPADLALNGKERWIVLASRETIDEAYQFASEYRLTFSKVQVVRAKNGRYTIVAGPERVKGSERIFVERIVKSQGVPPDTYLSNGRRFDAKVEFTPPPLEIQESHNYKVVDVASNDFLYVRTGPTKNYSVIGKIPPNGRGIRMLGSCAQGWCEINYQGTTGWVNRRFLGLENSSPERWIPYKTVDIEGNDVLNIRSGPSPDDAIIGKIPANTHCILSSDCSSDRWCHVTWGNITGWAHNRYLARDLPC